MISVLITAYNAAPFVGEAINSILAQTADDLECVVVDDGSTDGTVRSVRAVEDPRVRLIEGGRLGRGRALNLALARSRGDLVAIQDADDLSHPRRLEIEKEALARRPDLAGVGAGQMLTKSDRPPSWPAWEVGSSLFSMKDITRKLVFLNPVSHTTLLLRRDALEAVRGYDESRKSLYDWDILIRLAVAGHRVGRLSVPLAAKRIHRGQFFEGGDQLGYMVDCLHLQRRAVRLLGRSPLLCAVFPLLFAYRMLPRRVRIGVRQAIVQVAGRAG
ncbi:MAG: glycosyltransferase family 2 protein [Candidatus Tectomicrobia bacterium]|uniref:Glycosyltransferase family 2 protein n=1 Tax=Tectimicrobiota bacterium TaxID=2528274 RepID=A0A932MKZ7_UNCTE|nr:glycosyltransferase family 2 protein [Candidatus Tectomicrobia bacterium]